MKLVLLKSGRATELVFKMIGAFRQTCVSSKWLYLHTNLQSNRRKIVSVFSQRNTEKSKIHAWNKMAGQVTLL